MSNPVVFNPLSDDLPESIYRRVNHAVQASRQLLKHWDVDRLDNAVKVIRPAFNSAFLAATQIFTDEIELSEEGGVSLSPVTALFIARQQLSELSEATKLPGSQIFAVIVLMLLNETVHAQRQPAPEERLARLEDEVIEAATFARTLMLEEKLLERKRTGDRAPVLAEKTIYDSLKDHVLEAFDTREYHSIRQAAMHISDNLPDEFDGILRGDSPQDTIEKWLRKYQRFGRTGLGL